jgi:hypothetical protein
MIVPALHLIDFHECMLQLGIFHEDVLMKMFMISLEGDARQWYKSLPPRSISSVQQPYFIKKKRFQKLSSVICTRRINLWMKDAYLL